MTGCFAAENKITAWKVKDGQLIQPECERPTKVVDTRSNNGFQALREIISQDATKTAHPIKKVFHTLFMAELH